MGTMISTSRNGRPPNFIVPSSQKLTAGAINAITNSVSPMTRGVPVRYVEPTIPPTGQSSANASSGSESFPPDSAINANKAMKRVQSTYRPIAVPVASIFHMRLLIVALG